MATLASSAHVDLHISAIGASPSQILISSQCHGNSSTEIRASLRARSLSNNVKPLSTKSAPQLRESSPDCKGHEGLEEPLGPGRGQTSLTTLPDEIQESVLEYIVGNLCPISSSAGNRNGTRNWSNVMRHPRAKEVTNLALVAPAWRYMIQERLYRHIRIKGTQTSLETCIDWFLKHPHLQNHVRHIEFWVPVWEQRPISHSPNRAIFPPQPSPLLQGLLSILPAVERSQLQPITSVYRLSSQNSTLDELFGAVQCVFQSACILTIEGGNCKKPPMIQHFRNPDTIDLPELPQIRTLVMKGAWNIIRDESDYSVIATALPKLKDCQCMYATPKTRPYVTMYKALQLFPPTLTHLHLCMEGFYSKKNLAPAKVRELRDRYHLCRRLGAILPQLEALTLSGRVCSELFTTAMAVASETRHPRLRSLDLVVRNCCRDISTIWSDGTGAYNWGFVKAFEALVIGATAALRSFPDLDSMRIRFVDLDSPYAHMNPYFQLKGNEIAGIWSDSILANLAQARPKAQFLMEDLGKTGSGMLRRKRNIQVCDYFGYGEGLGI